MARNDLAPRSRENTAPSYWRDYDLAPLSSFRREMDRLFDDFFTAPTVGNYAGNTSNWPNIEVHEDDNQVKVTAELPGMADKDIDVSVDNGVLTIRGDKKGEQNERGYSERWYGRFDRRIPLPTAVDDQHAKADFRDGLLTVTLPKGHEDDSRKRIPINTETRH